MLKPCLLTTAVGGCISVAFAAGMVVSNRDAKLFDAYDKERVTMLARGCGTNAELLQNPLTYAFACVYRNKDGVMIMREVIENPMRVSAR